MEIPTDRFWKQRDPLQDKVVSNSPRRTFGSTQQFRNTNTMASNYAATISRAQNLSNVTDGNFAATEQKFAKQKLQMQETNLPGFSELKVDENLSI